MKQLTETKAKLAVRNWRNMQEHKTRMDELALQMLRHPDATPEQLWEVHVAQVRLTTDMNKVKQSLIDVLPPWIGRHI
jgi:hypothetical protein